MILITEASRNFGKAVIDFLLKNNVPLGRMAALVKDKNEGMDLLSKGITLRIGEYDNYASLVEAFNNVDQLLLISKNDFQNKAKHLNAVNAAKEAGVKHILYTSIDSINQNESTLVGVLSQGHVSTEKIIKESCIAYTIFRNNLFMDMLPVFLGREVVATGVYFPAGEGKAAFTLRADIAESIAKVLMGNGHENKEYCLSNAENISFGDIADILSDFSGEAVMYNSPDIETYISTLVTAGFSKEKAACFARIGEAIEQGKFYTTKSDLESLLGRKPTSLKAYLRKTFFSHKHSKMAMLNHAQSS